MLQLIRTSTLANGLQVVTEAMSGVESVALSFWVGTGSRDETDAQQACRTSSNTFYSKGSQRAALSTLPKAFDAVGGDMNAFTTKESTAFYVRVLSDDTDVALDILCDIMCDPSFDIKVKSKPNVKLCWKKF